MQKTHSYKGKKLLDFFYLHSFVSFVYMFPNSKPNKSVDYSS